MGNRFSDALRQNMKESEERVDKAISGKRVAIVESQEGQNGAKSDVKESDTEKIGTQTIGAMPGKETHIIEAEKNEAFPGGVEANSEQKQEPSGNGVQTADARNAKSENTNHEQLPERDAHREQAMVPAAIGEGRGAMFGDPVLYNEATKGISVKMPYSLYDSLDDIKKQSQRTGNPRDRMGIGDLVVLAVKEFVEKYRSE